MTRREGVPPWLRKFSICSEGSFLLGSNWREQAMKKYLSHPLTIAFYVLVAASIVTNGIMSPAPWLVDWTAWAATFLGISIGGRGVWVISDETVKYLQFRRGRSK